MRRLSLAVFLLFIGILVFFTFFGNTVYDWITPEVSVCIVGGTTTYENKSYMRVNKEAIGEDSRAFEIVSESGFSRELYYLRVVEIEYVEDLFDWEEGYIYVTEGLRPGIQLLLSSEGSHKDGDHVRVKRGR